MTADGAGTRYPGWLAPLVALRPQQWTKNGVVFAAFVFALGDAAQEVDAVDFLRVCLAALCFCFASSAIYLVNDVRDRELDRLHPTKRFRPVAAGQVAPRTAVAMSVALVLVALGLALWLSGLPPHHPLFLVALVSYLLMQAAYVFVLKHVPLVDVGVIAFGFLIRAVAGAVVIPVVLSHWLLGCTFLLALFLGLSKRRHEKVVLADLGDAARPSLGRTSGKLLDRLIVAVALLSLATYSAYTIAPATQAKFGGPMLAWTIPWVVLGIWRYFFLVYRREEGGRPEKVLLTDPPIIGIVLGYGATLLFLFRP